MLQKIKEMLLRYHRDLNFTVYPSFPLVAKDPSVLFTNATITPFKHFFSDPEVVPHNYALIQRCLRVRGMTEDFELMRADPNYVSLFEMFGSALFGQDYQQSVAYFLCLLGHIGLARENLRFIVPAKTDFTQALHKSGVDKDAIFTIAQNGEFWQHWAFGKNNLVGSGITAIYSYSAGDKPSSIDEIITFPSRFVEIGNLIHIYGREDRGNIVSIPHEGFEVGMGVERVTTTLERCSAYELLPFQALVEVMRRCLKKLGSTVEANEVPRILVDHLRTIGSLINEGVVPGNKQHGFVLRKMIRSFLEILWLSVGSIVSSEELIQTFVEFDAPGNVTLVVEIVRKEDQSFREALNRGKRVLAKNPGLGSDVLRGTYGIRQSLLPLLK